MEAEAIILADPYTYKFLKSFKHSALHCGFKQATAAQLSC